MSSDSRSDRGQIESGRVLLIVESDERQSLGQWFTERPRFELIELGRDEPGPREFDVCIFDSGGYERFGSRLTEIDTNSGGTEPACVLVIDEDSDSVTPETAWTEIEARFDGLVDDVIVTPIKEAALAGTVQSAFSLSRRPRPLGEASSQQAPSDQFDRTQHLEVLDRLLRHNLSNDINVIAGRAEIIKQRSTNGIKSHADTIIDKSAALVDTAHKEREIVRLIRRNDPPVEQDISDVVRTVITDLRPRFPNATFESSVPSETHAVASERFQRALEELLTNGVVHNDADEPTVTVSVSEHVDTVDITVADNGPGIPEHEANALVRRVPPDPLFHGRGLGLWLVYWLVQFSEGTISLEEDRPRGTAIRIRLPFDA